MRILGIETSCDETAVAIIDVLGSSKKPRVKVLSNIVSSQAKLHARFGGVVPNLAKREHQRNLAQILLIALTEAGLRNPKSQIPNPKQIQNSKLKILNTILEREADLFSRMVKYVLLLRPPHIDAIAVTVGPGLAPALWVGVNFARALAYLWRKPIIPVNHLEGHIYTNLLPYDQNDEGDQNDKTVQRFHRAKRFTDFIGLIVLKFPALCLIVSGGHTELVLMPNYGKYRVIGETLDDAAGEAFDKVAKMLGLGFPGGPEIAAQAAQMQNAKFKMQNDPPALTSPLRPSRLRTILKPVGAYCWRDGQGEVGRGKSKFKIKLPRPMIASKDYNFSFSGLKTAVLYLVRDLIDKYSLRMIRPFVAAEFEQAVVDVLITKTVRAAKQYRVKTVLIGGGVAANKKLRAELGKTLARECSRIRYLIPDIRLTGDNALMIALAGWFNRKKKTARWNSIRADANLRLTRA